MVREAMKGMAPFTLCSMCAVSLLACSAPASSTDLGDGRVRGLGDRQRLSGAEWAAYVGDAQYVHDLTPSDVPVRLNLADPRQYNFAMTRLKLAGKNDKNSPYLFQLIETRRNAQIASGLKAGTFAPAVATANGGAVAMHYIEVASVRNGQPSVAAAGNRAAPPRYATGAASSTFPGGSDYTYVDVTISTVAGDPIAPLAYAEDYGNPDGNTGANVTISTTGDPNVSSLTRYTFESYKYEQVGSDFIDSYIHAEIGSRAPKAAAGLPQLSVPAVDDPHDVVGPGGSAPEGLISVCMDRAWTNDCDYIVNTGSVIDHRIKLPLKGAVTITTAHVFDRPAITALQNALAMGQAPPSDPGLVKLVLTNVGGGCDVDAANALSAGMSGFWSFVTLSPDNRTLSWNVTGNNAIYFDEGCSQIQNAAKLTMRIPAPVLSVPAGIPFTTSFTISNDPATLRPDATLPPLTLTNSCLAEGTQIELATGTLAPIESLQIGQSVFNPFARTDHALTITDTASGSEASPMVRIRDAAGHTLLMTEMHPIATADHGMVQARALRTGDVVMTTQGPSKLIEVSREAYTGKVYNLKVGSQAEAAGLGQDQTVVHANGFVVGDGQIQSQYEVKAMKQGSRTTLEQVPERWRRDYVLSASRK
jgi:hypothetical protein